MVEFADSALKAIIDSFEIYIIKSLVKKKSRLILLCPKSYLG